MNFVSLRFIYDIALKNRSLENITLLLLHSQGQMDCFMYELVK